MKLAYATTYDVFNSLTWTKSQLGLCGAGASIAKALKNQSIDLEYFGPLNKKKSVITKAKWSLYRNFFKKDYYRWAEPLVLKDYAYQISEKLSKFNSDIVLCPENAVPIAYLECKQPVVLWTDSTLAGLIDFYPYLSNLCKETKENIYLMEQSALNKCELVILASEWAAQTAIDIYGINPSKVKVVPWGANVTCKRTIDDIDNAIKARSTNPCKLLFIGVEWLRKGGSVALEVARELNRMGLKTQLQVVGCQPKINESELSFVSLKGFIDKSTTEGLNEFNRLMAESHFLILPTLADCSPHVLIEANSFGVPCLTTNTGGIPTIIKNDFNGKTFEVDANIADYCNYIVSKLENYSDYERLAVSSFNEYQDRLNWNISAQAVKKLLIKLRK
ncbi:glycosyltransferase [Coleofasciculus sp. FACHB-T130]|uniref:glycosyltransferase n=1 Tax=Cyanophyceae TaxID=3028117 RepID=UPI0016887F1A|nr:glycosyltransferase [Coleofasciculus sp. FACHB-T130]MBD1882290.1 glycosyltransferase [Coleofasciculus sp. FACHB-T130]